MLFAHHIHMALQNDRAQMLVSRRGRGADGHVARFVNLDWQTMLGSKVLQESNHLLLLLGRAGYFIDFGKALEYYCRLQVRIVVHSGII